MDSARFPGHIEGVKSNRAAATSGMALTRQYAVQQFVAQRQSADRGRHHGVGAGSLATLVALVVFGMLQPRAEATPQGSLLAREALARCMEAEAIQGAEQRRLLREGLQLAEAAVEADDNDAAAHFAVFCNLGKQLRISGVGFGVLSDVGRVRSEIDRALELAPLDPDLLAAKGGLLQNLPRFLGGDEAEATQLLIRAFVADPSNRTTRKYLEKALQ